MVLLSNSKKIQSVIHLQSLQILISRLSVTTLGGNVSHQKYFTPKTGKVNFRKLRDVSGFQIVKITWWERRSCVTFAMCCALQFCTLQIYLTFDNIRIAYQQTYYFKS